jgi:hypothetical protein
MNQSIHPFTVEDHQKKHLPKKEEELLNEWNTQTFNLFIYIYTIHNILNHMFHVQTTDFNGGKGSNETANRKNGSRTRRT